MIDLAKKALDCAIAAGVDQAEAFALRSRTTKIKVYRQEVEELSSSTGSGVGIRVFRGRSVGYAYASDVSRQSLRDAGADAVANAGVAAPDEYLGLPEPAENFPAVDLYSQKLKTVPLAEKIELAREVERAALERDRRVIQVEAATYVEADTSVAIANSLGFGREFQETTCYSFLQAIAEQDGQMQTGTSFTTGREPGELEGIKCGREAADRAVSLLGASQCSSMNCAVVMDPFVAAGLIGVIGSGLTGEAVQKKRSLFADREGRPVAASAFTLVDDGTHPQGLASAPFDGEGVPTQETVLIKDGILQGFLYDAYTGRKGGRPSTGNGSRGSYRSMPRVGPTNLRVVGGAGSLKDIIASVDRGFYVMDITGIHSGANPVSGDFSVGAAGRLIKDGRLSDPVREVTVAGNLLSILKSVKIVGGDNRWVPFGGSIHAPTLLIGEMTVSGK